MKQYVCDHCGASIEHSYNHKCPYCNSIIDFNEDKVRKITPEDLVDLRLCSIERRPEFDSYLFYFKGYIMQKPKIYEYDGNETYTTKVFEYKHENLKEGYICIEMPIKELVKCNYDIGFIYNYLSCYGIDFYKNRNLEESILDKYRSIMPIYRMGCLDE